MTSHTRTSPATAAAEKGKKLPYIYLNEIFHDALPQERSHSRSSFPKRPRVGNLYCGVEILSHFRTVRNFSHAKPYTVHYTDSCSSSPLGSRVGVPKSRVSVGFHQLGGDSVSSRFISSFIFQSFELDWKKKLGVSRLVGLN